jgi:hypothetical protein
MNDSICRVTVLDNGLSTSEFWFEAKKLPEGFYVEMFVSEVSTEPELIFKSRQEFNIRIFKDLILEQNQVNWDQINPLRDIEVSGLNEDDVALLRLTMLLASDANLNDWFESQSQPSQQLLAEITYKANFNPLEFFQELKDVILEVEPKSNVVSLLNKNYLSQDYQGLNALHKKLIATLDISKEKAQRTIAERRLQKIAPFREEINHIANHFDNETKRVGAGISGSKPSKRTFIIRWLENYVVANCKMPKGKHNVEIPFLGGKVRLGVIDFSNPPNEHLSE